MGAILGLDALVNKLTGGDNGNPQSSFFAKNARVAGAAAVATLVGRWHSLWRYEGFPSHGAVPGAVGAPDASTPGGLRQTVPGGGRSRWITGGDVAGLNAGTLMVYDRLLHVGGLSGTVTTPQAVGGALTRNTGGLGNQIWAEIYTLIGTTAANISASYTDENDQAQSSASNAIGGTNNREVGRMIPIPLANSRGVKAVASVTLSGTTGTAGEFGITVIRPLMFVPLGVIGQGGVRDLIAGLVAPQEIGDACLGLAWMASVTVAPEILGSVHSVEA